MIPFNKPYLHGRELVYIADSVASGKISGDGVYTSKCHEYFRHRFGFKKVLLTTSCTDALEMSAILLNLRPGDEVIVPSFTFVSTANAFALRGATIVFADSSAEHPNVDPAQIELLVNENTKAIVVVHYAGMACEMRAIMSIADKHGIPVIEDAAQAIDSKYYENFLGGIGTFGAMSFHETKNIISGEGGLLIVNDESFFQRAEVIREKGTNRSSFFRGEVSKYHWVDIGSSFLPSDIIAAYLFAQLEQLDHIQNKRKLIWEAYFGFLQPLAEKGHFNLPRIPEGATNNAHIFYIVCKNVEERDALISYLKERGVGAVFHYQSLHASPYFEDKYHGPALPNAERFSNCLVRLPLFYEMSLENVRVVCDLIRLFFGAETQEVSVIGS